MKKKIVSLALVASLLALVIVGGTLAYFTDTESATNTFVVGNVDITLSEPAWQGGATSTIQNIQPGITYAKDPTVKNTGINDAYIRVNVTLNKWAEFAAAGAKHRITDLTTIFDGYDEDVWSLAGEPVVDAVNNTITYSYYYDTRLKNTDDAIVLFESVTIPAAFDNYDMHSLRPNFALTVTADAIQADGFDTPALAFAAFDAQFENGAIMDGDAYKD